MKRGHHRIRICKHTRRFVLHTADGQACLGTYEVDAHFRTHVASLHPVGRDDADATIANWTADWVRDETYPWDWTVPLETLIPALNLGLSPRLCTLHYSTSRVVWYKHNPE